MAHLALGIVSNIGVYAKNKFNIKDRKEEILKEINEYIDITKYDCIESKNALLFNLHVQDFETNIHALIQELYPYIDYCTLYDISEDKRIDVLSKHFNKAEYPIALRSYQLDDDCQKYCNRLYLMIFDSGVEVLNDNLSYWMFHTQDFQDNVELIIVVNRLWMDYTKIAAENEYFLINILNRLCQGHFKNTLSKNMLFYML